MRIYTKQGDDGHTNLLYGGRVSKADPRCEAYGTVDEAISALGLARALINEAEVRTMLEALQRSLFTVGAELATDPGEYDKMRQHFGVVTPAMTLELEHQIDRMEEVVKLPRSFIVPGGSPASGAVDLARGIVRRAERRVVELRERGLVPNPEMLRYLNRCSDMLFMLARYIDRDRPFDRLRPEPARNA